MCATCGCTPFESFGSPGHAEHPHSHEPGHEHHRHEPGHDHDHPGVRVRKGGRKISVEEAVLAKNDALAAENRHLFESRDLSVFNLTSSPGSGKTTLIESLGVRLAGRIRMAVVEGDQETDRDAERVRALGIAAVQVNTRTGCHLDASMVRRAVAELDPAGSSLLLIENVGNLVCPALFDLGERAKIVLMSVTEGEDKPLKYPHMFRAASVLLLSKIDLLPHLDFDVTVCLAHARRINPALRVFEISAKTGEGLPALCEWLATETLGASA